MPRLVHREHSGFSFGHLTLVDAQAWQLSRSFRGIPLPPLMRGGTDSKMIVPYSGIMFLELLSHIRITKAVLGLGKRMINTWGMFVKL
jgi:hypothetical protein